MLFLAATHFSIVSLHFIPDRRFGARGRQLESKFQVRIQTQPTGYGDEHAKSVD